VGEGEREDYPVSQLQMGVADGGAGSVEQNPKTAEKLEMHSSSQRKRRGG